MINNSEFHSHQEIKTLLFSEFHSYVFGIPLLLFSEFHSLIFKYEKKQRKKFSFSEFHSYKEFEFSSFSEFHSQRKSKNTLFGIPLPLKIRVFRNSTPVFSEFHSCIFGIPLPLKWALSPLNKRINEFIKSILKYNKSSFYLKRKIKVNKYK